MAIISLENITKIYRTKEVETVALETPTIRATSPIPTVFFRIHHLQGKRFIIVMEYTA